MSFLEFLLWGFLIWIAYRFLKAIISRIAVRQGAKILYDLHIMSAFTKDIGFAPDISHSIYAIDMLKRVNRLCDDPEVDDFNSYGEIRNGLAACILCERNALKSNMDEKAKLVLQIAHDGEKSLMNKNRAIYSDAKLSAQKNVIFYDAYFKKLQSNEDDLPDDRNAILHEMVLAFLAQMFTLEERNILACQARLIEIHSICDKRNYYFNEDEIGSCLYRQYTMFD